MTTQRDTLCVTLLVVTFAACTAPAAAYPPDNAAVLYYRAFMLYEPDQSTNSMRDDYWHGQIELNETLEAYLTKNQRVIDMVLDATRIDRCDWGLDYSQGTEVVLPPHHKARDIFFLVAAEATMQANKGHHKKALQRCVAMYRMARHLNERPIICYLVGTAVTAATHKCATRFLSEMPLETETLTWLQAELNEFDKRPFSIEPALAWKREAAIISMSPERIDNAVETGLDDGDAKTLIRKRIRGADPQFYTANVTYWNNFMDRIEAAFDLPYARAYAELGKLDKRPWEEFEMNPEATLTVCFAPPLQRIYSLSVRLKAQSNALRAAVAVYLSRARTGGLPEALPAHVPTDPFSGRPFEYTRTEDGFVLQCRGRELSKDEVYTFEFKVK